MPPTAKNCWDAKCHCPCGVGCDPQHIIDFLTALTALEVAGSSTTAHRSPPAPAVETLKSLGKGPHQSRCELVRADARSLRLAQRIIIGFVRWISLLLKRSSPTSSDAPKTLGAAD
jgi:hypothetical protein